MKTWMKAIPLVAGLAFMASALATPARADDGDRRRGDQIQLADSRSHGKHHGHKGSRNGYKQGYYQGKKHGSSHGRKHGYRKGHKGYKYGNNKGYRHGKHNGRKYGGHKYGGHKYGGRRHNGYGHGGRRHHYGRRHHGRSYGHRRHYVPYPAFVFRFNHRSSYEAPAERYPHVQQQVTPAVVTPVARDAGWPQSCVMTREYQTEIVVGGEVVEGYGQACLQPDGSWHRGPVVAVQ